MNDVCESEEIVLEGQPTLMELYTELNRLKLENEILKADNLELHNKLYGNVGENNEGGWTEEEFDIVAKAYSDFGY
jgi:hypothetical protein